ncbi:MAG: CehA/McbA family metallohydrolase [Oscillospiraceae bacterium]|nr:CehA/McbA family metallohydrolase [Oscillospiraceae bacterium]
MTYRVDLHIHTDASDDGLSPLAEQAAAAKAAGLDAIAVTDHNQCTPVPAELNGVLLIPGCEVSTRDGHITGLFLEVPLDWQILRAEGLPTGEAAAAEIHRRGGLAVLAHPFQSPRADPSRFTFPLDGVEAANSRASFKVRDANQRAAELARIRRLPAVGGSDGHSRFEVGNAYTEVHCPQRTLAALKQAIAAGNCQAVLVRQTPCYRKGLSQLGKARRKGGVKALAKGLVYLGYCGVRDLFHL